MYKLHYADKDLASDIPCFEFTTYDDLRHFMLEIFERTEQCVFLLTYNLKEKPEEDNNEIIISENAKYIYNFFKFGIISDIDLVLDVDVFFLQEYESYEDAYAVALDMKESSPLCYNKKK
jgi:hypothetical protein